MESENANKSKSGKKQNELLLSIAKKAKQLQYIKDYEYSLHKGIPEYKWDTQFYCPCVIQFSDDEKWLLYTSTSYRSDRSKEWFWDSLFMKELIGAKYSFLIYSESTSAKETRVFLSEKKKIKSKYGLYTIDDIFSESELEHLIQIKGTENDDRGLTLHRRGNAFEEKVAEVLQNSDNLAIFLTGNHILRGNNYLLFELILKKCGYTNESPIKSIEATCDKGIIGKLPSGGSPKTDVMATVNLVNDEKSLITISCKQSDSSKVSVHQYKADTFADVLDKDNKELRKLLVAFQNNPTLSDFGYEMGKQLESELEPYLRKLILWVISGRNGEGLQQQIANYILIKSDSGYSFYSADEYCDKLMDGKRINFGTPFQWTYASKHRGKSIQLKCSLL